MAVVNPPVAKIAFTVGAGAAGFLLQWSGFDAKLAHQPDEILERLRWIYLIAPLALWLCTLLFIWWYPLGRQRMQEIRNFLEKRRGAV